ncbi:MAG: hypothetical protein LBL73_01950 [Synergistaceae bacterium]|jgi:epoxyqueuosine reductase QueG|nr:hypothetical protein [Synergistaceae bacterium]
MKAYNELLNAELTARGAAIVGFGGDGTICGKCIEICPYTRRYLENSESTD